MIQSRFRHCFLVLPGVLTAILVWTPTGISERSRHYIVAWSFQDPGEEGFVAQQARLALEKPGVRINLIQTRFVDPVQAGLRLQLVVGKQKMLLSNISQLRGQVEITHEEAALRYVRLLTSPQTWYLWRKREMEVLEATTLPDVLAAGFGIEGVLLDPENGRGDPYWLYDPYKKKFELVRHTPEDKYIILKTEKYPDLSAYGTGYQGILSRKLFRAIGCTPPKTTAVKGGYEITRWLFNEEPTGSLRLVREFVGADGTYKRTVLQKKELSSLFGFSLLIPTFE
jgi:hypothetical protein